MKLRRLLKLIILSLCLSFITGIGLFLYNAYHAYNINNGFTPLRLVFDPDNSSSSYIWNGSFISVYGGFVKGIQKEVKSGEESLVIRALSPLPTV